MYRHCPAAILYEPRRPAIYADNAGRGEGSLPASRAPPPRLCRPAPPRGPGPGGPGR